MRNVRSAVKPIPAEFHEESAGFRERHNARRAGRPTPGKPSRQPRFAPPDSPKRSLNVTAWS
jgi:hypothetical protein